jgi:pyruvate,water dikinase
MTTPAWTPLFAIAGGIITETGGALSHPAITAREYGIPAVVALADATTRLKDGDIVTIDGATGTVTIG